MKHKSIFHWFLLINMLVSGIFAADENVQSLWLNPESADAAFSSQKIYQMSVVADGPDNDDFFPESEEQDGAAASDPTVRVSFVDFRYRWLELTGNHERSWYSMETSMMLTHSFKLVTEVHYWDTDLSGRSESNLESLHLKGILLSDPVDLGGVKPFGCRPGVDL